MSWITVLWSMFASACLTLALVNVLVWWRQREARANGLFAVMAVATAVYSACEIWLMRAETVEEYGRAMWWAHLPGFVIIVSVVIFVRIYLRAGRTWLAWAVCGTRALTLLLNFFSAPNLNYREIIALHHIRFLGETISLAEGVRDPWIVIGHASVLLLLAFTADAMVTVWRRGDRLGARWLSAAITFFALMATWQILLIFWWNVQMPLTPSLFFSGIVLTMGVELSWDIVRAMKLAEDLRKSEARLRTILEQAPLAISLSRNGTNLYGNKKFRDLFGLTNSGQGVGASLLEYFAPQCREEIQERIRLRARGQPVPNEYETVGLRADGTQFPMQLTVAPIQLADGNASMGFVVDITERKRAEAALRQSENKYRKIFENVQDVFYQVDNSGRLVEISPSIERYSGYCREELIGKPVEEVYYNKEDRAGLLKALQERGEVADYEVRLQTKTGRLVYASVNAHVLLDAEGKPAGIEGALRDITERRKLETDLRQSQKMEAIGQLAGGVAHDFNNILASTLMQVDLIGGEANLPVAVKEGLAQIRADTRRAAELTRQLLLFGRRQVMQPRILNLNDQVFNLVKMLQRIIGEDVHLELHLHPAPLLTHADDGMLDQVLMNLVVNARDAMPQGGRLRIETSDGIVSATEPPPHPEAHPGPYVCLSVSDTGGGIPAEVLPHIFEPFFTTKEAGKGTGLGLATVYGIVEQHQGWIQLANRPGQGVTFQVFLPASTEFLAETPSRDTQLPARRGHETILLVEDELGLLKLTRKVLERHGYRVLTAGSGQEALHQWQEHRATVALLLTDLVMPGGLSGQALAQRLESEQPQLKVIYISGYSAEIAGKELQLRDGEAFIQKPFATDHLLATIRQCLDGPLGS